MGIIQWMKYTTHYIAYMAGMHKHCFDIDNLLTILNEAGFKDARQRQFDPSIDVEKRRR